MHVCLTEILIAINLSRIKEKRNVVLGNATLGVIAFYMFQCGKLIP